MMTLRSQSSIWVALALMLAAVVACGQPLPNTPAASPAIPKTPTASPAVPNTPTVSPAVPDTPTASPAVLDTPTASPQPQIEDFTPETLAQYQGKVVVLNFWATWCVPCRNEMPNLEAIYRKHYDQGLVILGLDASESSEVIAAFVSKLGLTFPILRDSERKASDAYDVRFLPTTVFLNRNGQMVTRHVGVMDPDAMAAKVQELLR